MSDFQLKSELREKFLRDLNASERIFFLKKAKETIMTKGYRVSEDLFYFCYYLTIRERFRSISPERDEGMLRLLLVECKKDIDETMKVYEARLEETKMSAPDQQGTRFIGFFIDNSTP